MPHTYGRVGDRVLVRATRSTWIYDMASEKWLTPTRRTVWHAFYLLYPGYYIAATVKLHSTVRLLAWTFTVAEDGAVVNRDVIAVREYSEPHDALLEPDEAVRELAERLVIAKLNDLERPAPLTPETAMRLVARARLSKLTELAKEINTPYFQGVGEGP